jgi:hypothetical protein
LAFAALFLSDPLHLGTFFATGIGGGAIGVPPMVRDVTLRGQRQPARQRMSGSAGMDATLVATPEHP